MEAHHVLAIPYPGRGHINPLMNVCKLMATTRPNLVVTFVVTEEWLSFLISEPKPDNIQFRTIPNVIPSEKGRIKDFIGFMRAVFTKMEAPVESLVQGLAEPPKVILADTLLPWVVRLGERMNIPVASLWPMSATSFSIFYHHQLVFDNAHFKAEKGEELVNNIPGITPTRIKDLPIIFFGKGREILSLIVEAVSVAAKAQYLLLSTVIEALKAELSVPIYMVGPNVPYFVGQNQPNIPSYLSWLDDQPKESVLYISRGSFMSMPKEELDGIVAGLQSSGIRFFWVVRDENVATLFEDGVIGNKGMLVPWCDQLNVLCHPSIGGFWSHCGWNSCMEGLFAGVPFLTSPIGAEQASNSKQIVEDWKIGWKVDQQSGEITSLLQRFMDLDCFQGREMRRRAAQIRNICQEAFQGGTLEQNIANFIQHIS